MFIETKIEISKVEDLFIGAFEGGSSYWAEVRDLCPMDNKLFPDASLSERWFRYLMYYGGNMPVWEEGSDMPLGIVTAGTIKSALHLMQQNHAEHFASFLDDTYDAETSDVFFQLAVMNEVVYG